MSTAKKRKCPICGASAMEAYQPFCSKRCADVDLGKWMTGGYAVPAIEEDEPDSEDLDPRRSGPLQ